MAGRDQMRLVNKIMSWGNIRDCMDFFVVNYSHVKLNIIILCNLTSTAKAFFYSKLLWFWFCFFFLIFFYLCAIYNTSDILCKDEDQYLIKQFYHVLCPKNSERYNAGNQHRTREKP